MKKKFLVLIYISIGMVLAANEEPLFFKKFVTVNNAFIGKSLFAEQILATYDSNQNKTEYVKAISFFLR